MTYPVRYSEIKVPIQAFAVRSPFADRKIAVLRLEEAIRSGGHTTITGTLVVERNRIRGRFAKGWHARVYAIEDGVRSYGLAPFMSIDRSPFNGKIPPALHFLRADLEVPR